MKLDFKSVLAICVAGVIITNLFAKCCHEDFMYQQQKWDEAKALKLK